MIDILHRFLLQNRSISIPGLGTLHAERIPAKLNADVAELIAPGYSFRFDKYFDAPDKAFFVYLSGRQGVPEYESMRLYNQFAQDFRSAIMLQERVEWPGIGYFRKNVSGEVEFVQTRPVVTGFRPVDLKKAVKPDHEVTESLPVFVEKDDHTVELITPSPEPANPANVTGSISTRMPLSAIEPAASPVENAGEENGLTASPVGTESTVSHSPDNTSSSIGEEQRFAGGETADLQTVTDDYPSTLDESVDNSARTHRNLIRIGWGIAAAVSLLTILHFSQHGFNMKAVANTQSIQTTRP